MTNSDYKHWQLTHNHDGYHELLLDKHNSTTNVLSSEVLKELDNMLDNIHIIQPNTLVIRSLKSNGFCAGADVDEFTRIENYDQAYEHIRYAQSVFDKLEQLDCPTLCVIHGFCLGGGLELALACDTRIACDTPTTRLGLPEVKLGIHPGYGGSVRLIRLIGPLRALPLILAGRTVNARTASKLGIINYAIAERLLTTAIRQIASAPRSKPHKHLMNHISIIRRIVSMVMKNSVSKKVIREHYPAPYAQIEIWRRYGGNWPAMMEAEADSVAKLITTPTAQNLIRLFFLQNKLKALAKPEKDVPHRKFNHVHVIGAGVMGGDIAAWCALKGLKVTLQDQHATSIGPAIKRAQQLFSKRLKDPREIQHAHDRLIPDTDGYGLQGADIIIEAIFEDLEVKQKLFKSVESRAKPDAVLATNTSSIRIEDIASSLKSPERLVGIHFFNPVAQMQLVEIVAGSTSNTLAINAAAIFTHQIGKLPLPVKSSPGFLVNRVLMPYLLEAVRAYDEGIHGPVIDQAARNFGMPMGPIELADTVGLDICLHVADILASQLGIDVPDSLSTMVNQGKLGRKSGEGFYRYHDNRYVVEQVPAHRIPQDLTDRLILSLVNEAKKCLDEGIIENEELLDAGIVFGTGFAPFSGGPMLYAEHITDKGILSRLKVLENQYGKRFSAAQGWRR